MARDGQQNPSPTGRFARVADDDLINELVSLYEAGELGSLYGTRRRSEAVARFLVPLLSPRRPQPSGWSACSSLPW